MSNRTGPTSNSRRSKGARLGAAELFTRPKRTLPIQLLAVLWYWRWELTITITVFLVHVRLVAVGLASLTATGVMIAALGLLIAVPWSQRFLRTRCWCVITRHRIRVVMREMRTLNYSGNAAFILFCRGTKEGEAVWLWMRPGLSAENLENRHDTIAAACWARDSRITRSQRVAALVRVDITRRDPLATTHITNPLLHDTRSMPTGTPTTPRTLYVVHETPPANSTAGTSHKTAAGTSMKTGTSSSRDEPVIVPSVVIPTVITRNGEDVSDYV